MLLASMRVASRIVPRVSGTTETRVTLCVCGRTVWHAVNREICVWPIMATRCRADGGNRHGHGPFGFLRFSDFEPFDADGCRFRACAFALAFVWVWLFPTSAHATTHKRHKPHKTYSFFRFCGRIALGARVGASPLGPLGWPASSVLIFEIEFETGNATIRSTINVSTTYTRVATAKAPYRRSPLGARDLASRSPRARSETV